MDSQELADAIAETYADPLGFVNLVWDWGVGELEGHPGPNSFQRGVLKDIGAEVRSRKFNGRDAVLPIQIAVASGHGIGKSALCAMIIYWIMSTRPMCKGTVTASSLPQLETKTWAELGKWHRLAINRDWFRWTGGKNSMKFSKVDVDGAWFVAGQSSKAENSVSFQGQHADGSTSFYLFDEASEIEDVIWEVASGGMVRGEPMIFAMGNPTEPVGRFANLFKPGSGWITSNVDSRTVEGTNVEYLNNMVEQFGEDSDIVRVRVRGLFPRQAINQFISTEMVQAALKRPVFDDPGAPLVMGVDVARYGDDRSVIVLRKGRDAHSFPVMEFQGLSTMELADRVIAEIHKWRPSACFVDGVGVGGGVVDRLRQLGYRVVDVSAQKSTDEKYANKRAQMWGDMRDWLRDCSLPHHKGIVEDFCGVQYSFDAQARVRLEPKEDMKKRGLPSPDVADAFALTFYKATPYGDMMVRPNRQTFARMDYNEFG